MIKFLFLISIFFCLNSSAQEFPKDFIGNWEGDLYWYQAGKKQPQKVKMKLRIQPADSANHYTWQLIYGTSGEDNRPYVLKPVDTAKGHWTIDERNEILIDQYFIGDKFIGMFTVQNATIVNTYYRKKNKLIVEFISVTAKPSNTTGGTSGNIPPVDSYAVKSYQKAVLKKSKN